MANERKTVELKQAFIWVCDRCYRDNFARAVAIEPELAADLDPGAPGKRVDAETLLAAVTTRLDGEVSGEFLLAPSNVTCRYCGETYDVVNS